LDTYNLVNGEVRQAKVLTANFLGTRNWCAFGCELFGSLKINCCS